MKCRTWFVEHGNDGEISAGTILEHPEAHVLVKIGRAEPVDQECCERVGVGWSEPVPGDGVDSGESSLAGGVVDSGEPAATSGEATGEPCAEANESSDQAENA